MRSSTLTKSKSLWSSVQVVEEPGLLVAGQHHLETMGSLFSQVDSLLCLTHPMLVPFPLRHPWTVSVFSLLNLRGLLCTGYELGTGTTM